MFCAPDASDLTKELKRQNCEPEATATIYSSRMETDFAFVLTSDI
jgi:hypothetical protein